jgi:SAM-dependent methyltransferase
MTQTNYSYPGAELDLFAGATRWKTYWASEVGPYLGRSVLEVGAGFGGSTAHLCRGRHDRWIALEPDAELADRLRLQVANGLLPPCCYVRHGTLADLDGRERFDSILYADVLEHIGDDREEVRRATAHLAPGGHLIVLAPAHQFLYTPFDEAVGHYRRYDRETLLTLGGDGLRCVAARYLDSVGLLASLANRLFLRSAAPTSQQIRLWDSYMVRCSRLLDPLLAHRVGKSLLVVWRREGATDGGGAPSA